MAENKTQLDIVIRMLADGQGEQRFFKVKAEN